MKLNKRTLLLLLIVALLFAYNSLKANPAQQQVIPQISSGAEELQEAPTLHLLPDEPETEAEPAPAEVPVPAEEELSPAEEAPAAKPQKTLPEDGEYDSKEEVALYIHLYGHLPSNYITKKAAEKLGWSGGRLEGYAPGKCIGGTYFGNYEGILPEKKGREYHECDIDTMGAKSRGAKRIVFSNDGLIYYTDDHYESFELLYGEP